MEEWTSLPAFFVDSRPKAAISKDTWLTGCDDEADDVTDADDEDFNTSTRKKKIKNGSLVNDIPEQIKHKLRAMLGITTFSLFSIHL